MTINKLNDYFKIIVDQELLMQVESLNGVALVVDDEEGIREVLLGYMEFLGLSVEESCCGEDALEMIEQKKYNYICTDKIIPDMSGIEFIKKAKKLPYGNTKYIIVTGYVRPTSKDILELLCDSYIEKP
jgi:CheY-like chemotaxis protein